MRNKHLYELLFILLAIAALFSGLSLFSYNPEDPSYSNIVFNRYQDSVQNLFGKAGAYSADWLGTIFGWPALILPFAFIYILVQVIKIYRGRLLRLRALSGIISFIMLILTFSVMSGLIGGPDLFFADKINGGLLGVAGSTVFLSLLGKTGGIMLCVIFAVLWLMGILRLSLTDLAKTLAQRAERLKELRSKENAAPKKDQEDKDPLAKRFMTTVTSYISDARNGLAARRAERQAAREFKQRQEMDTKIAELQRINTLEETIATGDIPLPPETNFPDVTTVPEQTVQSASIPSPDGPVITSLEDLKNPGTTRNKSQSDHQVLSSPPPLIVPPFQRETPVKVEPPAKRPLDLKVGEEQIIEDFMLPEGEELFTVTQLEELLAEQELKQQAAYGESTGKTPVTEPADPLQNVTVQDLHHMERAPRHLKNRITGDDYNLPFDLLDEADETIIEPDLEELRQKADMLLGKLRDFGVDGRIREIRPGPVVTLFELEPAPGIKISKIANLENDLALAMSAISIRIIAPIPGKAAVGIEIPNEDRSMVKLRELLETKDFKENDSPLVVALGKDISGKPYYSDLKTMPHLLVAGTTGSGKSVCINTIICSILYKSSPDAVKFVMIDPKMVELNIYNNIPHLAAPVVTDPRKAAAVLNNVVKEMEARYKLLSNHDVRNIDSYNRHARENPDLEPMPFMVVIVDEFGDLMMVAGKEVENAIIRIAQMARAVGIHLVLATQRPSVNVITGIIKANMPARISFRVSSKIDSRTILDQNGAELLLGRGDSLFIPPGTSNTLRIHGCFVSEDDVKRVVKELRSYGEPEYNMALLEENNPATGMDGDEDDIDPRYEEALQIVKEKGVASISMIQRYLRIGYNRAARIVETMEQQGLIGPSDGTSRPRELLKKD